MISIDDIAPDPEGLVEGAASLAPYPCVSHHNYPGLRRELGPGDAVGRAYATYICQQLVPLMAQVYRVHKFAIFSASFSLVTTPREQVRSLQALPHIDTQTMTRFAVLHYLSHHENSGTAFFRQKATGFETISSDRYPPYSTAREQQMAKDGVPTGYMNGSAHGYEEIGRVQSRFNRLIVYPGALLHSGLVPDDFDFSPDPRVGRLTGNIFIDAIV